MEAKPIFLKAIVIGSSGVGKTNLMQRYVNDTFSEHYKSTIGIDFCIKAIKTDDKTIKLQIWDTAGQERFKNLTISYYKAASCVLAVFSLTDKKSFEDSESWIKEAMKANENHPLKIILVGNKSDLVDKRVVTYEEAMAKANSLNISYIETSAKNGHNVEQAFLTVTESFLGIAMKCTSPSSEITKIPTEVKSDIPEVKKQAHEESKAKNDISLEAAYAVLKLKLEAISKLVKALGAEGSLLADNIKKVIDAKNTEKIDVDLSGNLTIH